MITPMAFLAFMTWAVIKSNQRWTTLIWIVASLAVSVSLFAGAKASKQKVAEWIRSRIHASLEA
jgi:hypothetical protein